MTTIDRRDLVRGAFATSFLGLTAVAVGGAPSALAAIPTVSRTTVIDRAWFWVNRNVQYSQSATYPGPAGQARYRTDCSGYVSMCLMLPAPGPNTTALAGSTYTVGITKANLRKGDMLVDGGNHVVLFQRWTNDAKTAFMLFEQSNPTTDMNHREASLSSYSGFQARRARNIRD
jgi:hypothetical protein